MALSLNQTSAICDLPRRVAVLVDDRFAQVATPEEVYAALYAIRPNFGDALGRIASNARQHPVRFFLLLVTVSAAVFIPMLAIFGAMSWTSIGPFQFQTARLFHYAVYFLAGIGVGAYGIDRGLLAPDGILARTCQACVVQPLPQARSDGGRYVRRARPRSRI